MVFDVQKKYRNNNEQNGTTPFVLVISGGKSKGEEDLCTFCLE